MADRVVKVSLVAQVSNYVAGMEQATKKTQELGSSTEKLAQQKEAFNTLGVAAVALGGGILAIGAAALKTGIEYNTLQQTSRAALTTILGSGKAAADQMDRLDVFARTSPFAKQTFLTAQQQMLAFGIETKKVIPYLDAVQNAIAASGGSNVDLLGIVDVMSKIQSSAKITAEDLNQFGGRGINAAELIGSSMGKTAAQIRTEITAGTLDAQDALDALALGMETRFGGAAANVKQTFVGATDRLKAAWRDFSAELATPLVNPNGGGALIDLLNWAADTMRAFEKLPEPVKMTISAVTGLTGAVLLAGGTFLLAVPKIAEFRAAIEVLGPGAQRTAGIIGKVGKAIGALAVIGVAIAALDAWKKAVESAGTSSADLANALATAQTSNELLARSFKDKSFLGYGGDVDKLTSSFGKMIDQISAAPDGRWMGVLGEGLTALDPEADHLRNQFAALGDEIANMSPDAASATMQKLITDYKLTDAQVSKLIELFPAYREALVKQATDAGLAADNTTLLHLALNEVESPALSAADAYLAAADKAAGLDDQLRKLIDTVNAANGVGQDAVSANATYQKSLAGISAEIQAQRDEYEKANGTLDGFTASLDESTVVGSANAEMLAALAGDAQAAAEAQYQLDLKTMSAKDATDKFVGTLVTSKEAIIAQAIENGLGADAVQALTDKVYAVPDQKQTEFLVQTATANSNIDAFVASWDGKQITMSLFLQTYSATEAARAAYAYSGGNYGLVNANGGLHAYADGGIKEGIYKGRPGGILKFAEPEVGWEAFISGKPGQEKRNIGIWAEAGHRLGVPGYANGGMVRPEYVSSGYSGGNYSTTTGSTFDTRFVINQVSDPIGTANAVVRRLAALGA